jgi:hypothetical protein
VICSRCSCNLSASSALKEACTNGVGRLSCCHRRVPPLRLLPWRLLGVLLTVDCGRGISFRCVSVVLQSTRCTSVCMCKPREPLAPFWFAWLCRAGPYSVTVTVTVKQATPPALCGAESYCFQLCALQCAAVRTDAICQPITKPCMQSSRQHRHPVITKLHGCQ